MKKLTLLSLCVWFIGRSLTAQGTAGDYNRAFSLQNKLKDKVFYSDVTPKWIGDSDNFWYVRNTPQGKMYVLTNAKQKKQTGLFDQNKLAVE
ncbi:MAG: S9 family peptidase, partial [Paludibacter sp.]